MEREKAQWSLKVQEGSDLIGDELDQLLDSMCGAGGDAAATLDQLDSIGPSSGSTQRRLLVGGDSLDSLSEFSLTDMKASGDCQSMVEQNTNPLKFTHDFTQACNFCFTPTGPGVLDFQLSDVSHSCMKDLLLCRRRKTGLETPWRRVRPRPQNGDFKSAFVLCREVLQNQWCKFGENCTFAYCPEEIAVWTQERRGLLARELLFRPVCISDLLNTHPGTFTFFCQVCFDSKPQLISRCRTGNSALCTNTQTPHSFSQSRCLVRVMKQGACIYSRIRPVTPVSRLEVCPRCEGRSCEKGDGCVCAHSLVELHVWILQRDSGVCHEEIVQESAKRCNKSSPVNEVSEVPIRGVQRRIKVCPLEETKSAEVKGHGLAMRFVCGQCWSNGLQSEADTTLKNCSSKHRHSWSVDRRVLLVRIQERGKWVAVRPLPCTRTFPQQYEVCSHMLKRRKCVHAASCSFAHSEEERQMWSYMKSLNLRDVQQVYDVWISTNQSRPCDSAPLLQQPIEDKPIVMPTDFAEEMEGKYCELCNKHSNSGRQWQQHISSHKHKQRVLNVESLQPWTHRFPGPSFSICPRLSAGCPDGAGCDFAHSEEELQEWKSRRTFLQQTVRQARDDGLISSTDNQYGIYSFLLQDAEPTLIKEREND